MQHFGGLTAKHHLGISNSETVGKLDLGKLAKSVRKKLASSRSKSASTYKSKSGRSSFKGSRFLKDTGWEPYSLHLANAYHSVDMTHITQLMFLAVYLVNMFWLSSPPISLSKKTECQDLSARFWACPTEAPWQVHQTKGGQMEFAC